MATRGSKVTRAAGFRVPADLLRSFQNDVRFIPQHLPVNGWIIFDIDMLTSALRKGDRELGAQLATHLEKLKQVNGQLVIMENKQQTF